MSDERSELVWEFEKGIIAALRKVKHQQTDSRVWKTGRGANPKAVYKDEQECFLHFC
jgi:hypothetical protein